LVHRRKKTRETGGERTDYSERKRRVRKRKKSLCLPGGEEEREWEGRSIEAESRGVELSTHLILWSYEPMTIAGWPPWIKDSWTRGVHVKTASHFFRKKKDCFP